MRRLALVATCASVLFVLASVMVGSAGAGGGSQNEVIVDKVVVGPVPAGAVFEIDVACVARDNDATPSAPMVTTLTYDETGAPIGNTSVVIGAFDATCTVTETEANGATVTYACEATNHGGQTTTEIALEEPVTCTDDQTVQFRDTELADGTVTVTNTFPEDPPPPDPGGDTDDAGVTVTPAGVVAGSPTFTG